MKNNLLKIYLFFLFLPMANLASQELEINSSVVKNDMANKVTIFEGDVNAKDEKNNQFFSEAATYDEEKNFFETTGQTKVLTSNGYEVSSSNVQFDNKKQIITSKFETKIVDKDGNIIDLENFNYSISTNIFF